MSLGTHACALLFELSLLSCASFSQDPQVDRGIQRSPAESRTLLHSRQSGLVRPLRVVVRSQSEWTAIWAELRQPFSPPPPTPPVDFAKEVVVVIAAGPVSPLHGYGIENISVGEIVEVTIYKSIPSATDECISPLGIDHPVQAVAIPNTDGQIVFEEHIVEWPSCRMPAPNPRRE
jgi:hypothetical protein